MKYVVALAVMAVGLYALTSVGVRAEDEPTQVLEHHNYQHRVGPCGPYPCPKEQKPTRKYK